MFLKKNKKNVSLLCILSLFSSNIHAMLPENTEPEEKIENIEEKYTPISDKDLFKNIQLPGLCDTKPEETPHIIPLDDQLLKNYNFPWATMCEAYQTPTKSKLMLQEPKMSDNFKQFVYKELCPEPLKDLIKGHKKLGQEAFNNMLAKHLPRVVVLYGPNGTGKSTLGILIAKKLDYKLVFINSGFLGTMYRQSEEVNLSEEISPLLENGTPCVVVIDEADALVGKNDDKDNINRNKSAAMAQMMDMLEKNPNFILVWTTNNIDQIDAKFKDRIGICKRIEVKLPNQQQREKIIKYLIKEQKETSNDNVKIVCENSFNDFSSIAKNTEGFSIRSLEELVSESLLKAITRIPKKNEETLTKNKPITIVLKESDFNNISKKIKTGICTDKKTESNKNTLKNIKEYGLIGCAITIACATLGGGLSYLISKSSLDQAKMATEQNRKSSILSLSISAAGIAISALLTTIGLIYK
jgi:adenylate kinase family enzyme